MTAAIAGARVSGSHGDSIIFVHGVGSTAAIWDRQLIDFASECRCFAVELRGNGSSKPDPPAESITREGYVDDVLAVADAMQCARFHFVGCSLGGVVGFELYRRAPQRLISLTLVGSFAAYPHGDAYASHVIAAVRRAGSMETFAYERARVLGMPEGTRKDETIAQMACKSVGCYVAATRATWTGDYREILPAIRVPVLVLRGERDSVVSAELAQEIAGMVPGARSKIIEGAGHVANADAPEKFNALLREFIRSLETG